MGPGDQDSAAEVSRLWQDQAVQSEALCALARSLEKRGTFSLTSWLALLAAPGALSTAQVIDLYTRLRKLTWRNELEWRQEFTAAFPSSAGSLPSPEREVVIAYWEEGLCHAVLTGNTELLQAGLEQLARAGVSLADLGRIDRATIAAGEWIPEWDETLPGESLTLAELAELLGRPGMAALLRTKG